MGGTKGLKGPCDFLKIGAGERQNVELHFLGRGASRLPDAEIIASGGTVWDRQA